VWTSSTSELREAAANAGRLLTRDEILDTLWGVDYLPDSNVVDRHIRNLRAKLQNSWRRPRAGLQVPAQRYRRGIRSASDVILSRDDEIS
jgi:DNA-binding winged helix-turn-helix (wHTH) protein